MDFLRLRLLPLLAATLLVLGGGVYSVGVTAAQNTRSAHSKKPAQFFYVCPMHEDVTSKTRGKKCPKCKMKLERKPVPKPSQ